MPGIKHRLRFAKRGSLRLLSHLDLMRSVERLCRRADIPFSSTGGFHPQPRLVYALSLPLGIEGRNEVLEVELEHEFEAEVLLERLRSHSPVGLDFTSCYAIDVKVAAMVRRKVYRLALTDNDLAIVEESIPRLLNMDKIWSSRQKPKPRQINIKPYIRTIVVSRDPEGSADAATDLRAPLRVAANIELDLWVTPYGTARADELIALLGLPSPFETGMPIEREDLELHDETYDQLPDAPPEGGPELKPLSAGTLPPEPHTATTTWGMSPNGPVVE